MNFTQIQQTYSHWSPFQDPEPELVAALEESLESPDEAWDRLYEQAVDDFDDTADGFWIEYAIKYFARTKDVRRGTTCLERILNNPDRYAVLGGMFSAAASYLGKIATYPNAVLRKMMETADTGNEARDFDLQYARAAAFGGYVMTATSFDYGLNAGRAILAEGRKPTVEEAEKLIRDWQAGNGYK